MLLRMMKVKIAETAEKHGVKSAYALQKALDLSPTIAARLWKGEFGKIGINTLEKLCERFQCQTNDLLEYPLTQKSNAQKSNDTQKGNTELSKMESASGDETLLSTIQVAERLGVSRKSVNDYIIDGKLPAQKGKQNHNFVKLNDVLIFEAASGEKS
jgi:DNA-binding Xre family transcriptional regulator